MYGGKYGRIRYGLGTGTVDFEIRATFFIYLKNTSSLGADIEVTESPNIFLGNTAILTNGVPESFSSRLDLAASANLVGAVPITLTVTESLTVKSYLSENISIKESPETLLSCKNGIGKNMLYGFRAESVLDARLWLSQNVSSAIIASEVLLSLADVNTLEAQTIQINVTLPPGGKLRVDSENFTVTLDGQNILYLQEGEWIEIGPETVRLLVGSGTGGPLSGKLIYTGRYL